MIKEDYIELTTDLLQVITPEQAWQYRIVPKTVNNGHAAFYIDENADRQSVTDELEILFGDSVELEPADSSVIQKTLSTYYRVDQRKEETSRFDLRNQSEDFLSDLIQEAKQNGSSDIHIEIYEEKCRVRIRIDGMLVERYLLDNEDYPSLVNKIKIMGNMDIAEKRLPQDGRIFFERYGDKFDIRVSVLPTLFGEKIVLRLLSNDATNIDIRQLGFSEQDLENYLEGVRRPQGIILLSGPTGSGKTTTLYATLKILNETTKNIITIEDPIEYTLEGINQVQLKESIGLDFGRALRTFLRQDPDIIMVGEIRDADTASMAVRAAMTGHLVLSTIHTNSAWGTVSRLVDMGVPPFLVADTLNTTAAQRLLRLLCDNCKQEKSLEPGDFPPRFKPFRELASHFVPVGCEECHYTGYKGRKAIYEVIPVDRELADSIKNNEYQVDDKLNERGVHSLAENAFSLLEAGKTSLEEVYPVLVNF